MTVETKFRTKPLAVDPWMFLPAYGTMMLFIIVGSFGRVSRNVCSPKSWLQMARCRGEFILRLNLDSLKGQQSRERFN